MSGLNNLDNLISKILKGCEEKAKKTIEEAEAQAAEIIQNKIDAAEKEKERILSDAEAEAERSAERIVLSKRLEIRNQELDAKRGTLDKVFSLSLDRLNNMNKDEYIKFLRNSLAKAELVGNTEIILPAKFTPAEKESIVKELDAGRTGPTPVLYKGDRTVGGGFVLLQTASGVENNCSSEALIDFYRYELESEVLNYLEAR